MLTDRTTALSSVRKANALATNIRNSSTAKATNQGLSNFCINWPTNLLFSLASIKLTMNHQYYIYRHRHRHRHRHSLTHRQIQFLCCTTLLQYTMSLEINSFIWFPFLFHSMTLTRRIIKLCLLFLRLTVSISRFTRLSFKTSRCRLPNGLRSLSQIKLIDSPITDHVCNSCYDYSSTLPIQF